MESRGLRLQYIAAVKTDVGKRRSVNQDSANMWLYDQGSDLPRAILIVADGVGGQQAGEVASRLAVEVLIEELSPKLQEATELDDSWRSTLEAAFVKANDAINNYAAEHDIDVNKMGTTVECVTLLGVHAYIAHIGDSRIYQLGRNGLSLITEDHSAVAQMVKAGVIQPDEIYTHPHRNILLRGLGGDNEMDVDIFEIRANVGDRFMLCSDGLWGMVRDKNLENIVLDAQPPDVLVEKLINAANDAGGDDNIAVIVCDILPA